MPFLKQTYSCWKTKAKGSWWQREAAELWVCLVFLSPPDSTAPSSMTRKLSPSLCFYLQWWEVHMHLKRPLQAWRSCLFQCSCYICPQGRRHCQPRASSAGLWVCVTLRKAVTSWSQSRVPQLSPFSSSFLLSFLLPSFLPFSLSFLSLSLFQLSPTVAS